MAGHHGWSPRLVTTAGHKLGQSLHLVLGKCKANNTIAFFLLFPQSKLFKIFPHAFEGRHEMSKNIKGELKNDNSELSKSFEGNTTATLTTTTVQAGPVQVSCTINCSKAMHHAHSAVPSPVVLPSCARTFIRPRSPLNLI